jgi:hypothetical protein
MSRLNFRVACPDCGDNIATRERLIEAVLDQLPHVNAAAHRHLQTLSDDVLAGVLNELAARNHPTLRTHTRDGSTLRTHTRDGSTLRTHTRDGRIPVDEIEAMAGFAPSFRYRPGAAATPRVNVEDALLGRRVAVTDSDREVAPPSSFRPNARLQNRNRGGEFRKGKPQTREEVELELAEELHTHGMLPSSFTRNPRVRRAS